MEDNMDEILMEYFQREERLSTEAVRRVNAALDKKEREIIWKQICFSSLFTIMFTALLYAFINVFLGSFVAKVVLIGSFAFSVIGSVLLMFIPKKELILEGGIN